MFTRYGEAMMNQCPLCIDTPMIGCYNSAINFIDKTPDFMEEIR